MKILKYSLIFSCCYVSEVPKIVVEIGYYKQIPFTNCKTQG